VPEGSGWLNESHGCDACDIKKGTMKVTLNEKTIDLGKGKSHGGDVRAKLAPSQSGYSLYRIRKGPTDALLLDRDPVRAGQSFYSVPPCHGA
jgi:hypothetical protein